MPHCTRRPARCTRPSLWVPQEFHPEDTLPPKLRIYAQHANYVMHCVVTRIASGNKDCARLKNEYLRNIIGHRHCEDILQALLSNGDLQRVSKHLAGQHSRGYRPAEEHISQALRRFVPTDPYLLDKLLAARQQAIAQQARYRQPIHDFRERSQRRLSIDGDEAYEVLQRLPITSNPFGVQGMLAERIRSRQFRLSVDPYGRVHNSITNLNRQLRPSLRTKGAALAHVDIVNSQPALLAVCLDKQYRDPRFPSGSGEGETRSDRAEPGGGEPTTIYDAARLSPIEGGDRYQQLATSGRLHEHLMAKTGMPRKAVKQDKTRSSRGLKPCRQKCSVCIRVQTIKRVELWMAARLRCPDCGGPLNWFREA